MKKSLIICLALLGCFGAFALAEDECTIEIGKDVTVELIPGNGEQTVRAQYVGVDDDRILELVVFGSDGGVNLYDTQISTLITGRVDDINQDGTKEILLSGGIFAMDDVTYCLSFSEDAGITAVPFADIDRGSERTGYTETGYGRLISQPGEKVQLSGYQDILGTYVGYRTFDLVDNRLELCDDGLWHFIRDDEDDLWGHGALTLIRPLEVTMEDGRQATLETGDSFIVTASDLTSIVYFETKDGRRGSFSVEPNVKNDFGSLINGVSENDYFEYIPYAG